MHHEPRPCSVAVDLSKEDLGVPGTTVDLYRCGMAPLIMFTSATSPTIRARVPRAEVVQYCKRPLELGFWPEDVRVKANARNTGATSASCGP